MFRQSVYSTVLTGDTADMVFDSRIIGNDYGNDKTFLATMRALLDPRMPEEAFIKLEFKNISPNREMEQNSDLGFIGPLGITRNKFRVYDVRVISDKAADVFDLIRQKFPEQYPEYTELRKVADFYQNSFRVLCFLDQENKSVCMFAENINLRKLHYLECAILCSLPWYFDPSKGITDDERAVINGLQDKESPEAYIAAIAKIAEKYDFNTIRVKRLLAGIETEYERCELDNVEIRVREIDDKIRDLSRRYEELNKQRTDMCIRRAGLRESINRGPKDDSDIMGYFMRNKHLYLENVVGTQIRFSVHDYMEYFDEESVSGYISNRYSYIYNDTGSVFTASRVEKLMRAIFIDCTLKLRTCASFTINLNGNVRANGDTRYKDFGGDFLSSMPNPHLDGYQCMGGYERKINEALTYGNYIAAIEQCIASTKSLNFHDDTVIGRFMRTICDEDVGTREKYIELPDGTIVSPREALDWIENKEKEGE